MKTVTLKEVGVTRGGSPDGPSRQIPMDLTRLAARYPERRKALLADCESVRRDEIVLAQMREVQSNLETALNPKYRESRFVRDQLATSAARLTAMLLGTAS